MNEISKNMTEKLVPDAPLKSITPLEAAKKYGWPLNRPKICELVINFACNARCMFCYNPNFEPQWSKGELSLRDIAISLKKGREEGAWFADILGGEVTLRKDLPEIGRLARKLGYTAVQITTNGLLLSDYDYAKRLVDAGINAFRMSLHAAREELSDKITGVPGGFRKTVKALENIVKLGCRAGINNVIFPINYKYVAEVPPLVTGQLGIDAYLFISPHYLGAMKTNGDTYKIRYRDYVPYLRQAFKYFEDHNITLESASLSNFVPCVLPEYANLMAEWKYQKRDDLLFVPNEEPMRVYEMKESQRMKADRCKECAYCNICMGFEREYYNYFGGEEFVPLKEVRKEFPLKTYYNSD